MTAKSLAAGGYCFYRFHTRTRGITLGNSEQRVSSDLRDRIVPDKLGNLDPFGPIVLSVFDVGSKVLIDLTIHSFCLSVSLRVEHSGHLPFNTQQLIQLPQEVACKD